MNRNRYYWPLTEVFNVPAATRQPTLLMRQVSYEGRLWFLTEWATLTDITGRWYISMKLENGREAVYAPMDPLEFQMKFLPSLPWIELSASSEVPPRAAPAARRVARQARG